MTTKSNDNTLKLPTPKIRQPAEIIEKLKKEGIIFADTDNPRAEDFFTIVSERRFRIFLEQYKTSLIDKTSSVLGEFIKENKLLTAITFDKIKWFYEQDTIFRGIMTLATRDVEIRLRTKIILILGKFNPEKPENSFHQGKLEHHSKKKEKDKNKKGDNLRNKINDALKTYEDMGEDNPLGHILEYLDFSKLYDFLDLLSDADQQKIAAEFNYGNDKEKFLTDLKQILYTRNHHSHHRILIDDEESEQKYTTLPLYDIMLIIYKMLKNDAIEQDWQFHFVGFLKGLERYSVASVDFQGYAILFYDFPPNWDENPIWQKPIQFVEKQKLLQQIPQPEFRENIKTKDEICYHIFTDILTDLQQQEVPPEQYDALIHILKDYRNQNKA